MEKFVTGIQHLDINKATYHKQPIDATYVNFFFGNNGVGKTTISREIAALKRKPNWISDEDIPQGITFESGKTQFDYNFLVYNQDFIADNFRQLDALPGVFMIDAESIGHEDKIIESKKEKEEADKSWGNLKKQMDYKTAAMKTLGNNLEEDCWKITRALRARYPETMKTGTKTKAGFLAEVKKVKQATEHDQANLEALYDTAYDKNARRYNLFKKPEPDVMESVEGLDLLTKRIVSSSETDFARFLKKLNATDWVRQGHDAYHDTPDNKCPYCQQKLPDTFEQDLADCFDEAYQQEVSALGSLLQAYKDEGNNLWVMLKNNTDDAFPKLSLTEYKDKITILTNAIAANIQKIEKKVKEPATIAELELISPYIEEINSIIDGFNVLISSNNEIVKESGTKKQECVNKVWELMAFQVKDVLNKYNSDIASITSEYNSLKDDAEKKQKRSRELADEISELNKHTVNTEEAVKSMNKMLKDSGFQGFSIQEHPDSKNHYQIIREDGTIAQHLSEGEIHFIAFLYFCNLVHGNGSTKDAEYIYTVRDTTEELSDGRDMRDKIVVIDDPVSSMDSNSLFIVSSLVRQMISICKNNVTLEKNAEQKDYIKQIFILTHNAYFHREITVNQEQDYQRVSFFLITKNDNKSAIKLCTTKNNNVPTELRNYNPVQNSYAALWTEYNEVVSSITLKNVIRRILEYYFIQICGYDGLTLQDIILVKNRKLFVKFDEATGEEIDTSELQVVSSMISYITAPSFGVNEGLHFIEDSIAPEIYKDITKRIFDAMGQPQHYQMMSSISIAK